ncbi:glycerophosphodiester phosphodiesterase [Streptomyces sp. NPDC006879]|uniref:glycerophosphodiester phosphodiesterase n=1 Tax=Streptomyces sp. NPDC006879 TaxID=3364767 RepID=UPI0036895F29
MVMRSLLAALIALSLASQAGGAAPHEWRRPPVTFATLPPVTYVAHRGGALESPENSMSALSRAFDGGTVQVLDADTRVLADGTLVVMHDAKLDRTTASSGRVRDLVAAQWRSVRLQPGGERPPTVAEVLDRFGGRSVLLLEAKDPAGLPALAREIHRRGLASSVLINSNRPEVARRVHRLGLTAQLWRSARQLREDDPAKWASYVSVLDVDHRARPQDLRRALRSGIGRVWAHTVNTPEARDRMLRLGCDGIITDAPALLARTAVKGR